MFKHFIAVATAFWMLVGTSAQADQLVVVELFTSQGCSSCPPADKILAELTKRDDVLALAYHVDYWDYLGWKDEFAVPVHTKLQRAYARAAGERTIYTPQMVIGGTDHVIGSRPMKISHLLQKHAARNSSVEIKLDGSDGAVVIRARALGKIENTAVVRLVTYIPEVTVNIKRGENAGRTVSYHNIVRKIINVSKWDGRTEFKAAAKVPKGVSVVVMVQSRAAGPILGVAHLR